jgi:hypothetical protein
MFVGVCGLGVGFGLVMIGLQNPQNKGFRNRPSQQKPKVCGLEGKRHRNQANLSSVSASFFRSEARSTGLACFGRATLRF